MPASEEDDRDDMPGGTRLESVDEIRAVIQAKLQGREAPPEPQAASVLPFRPRLRPPLTMLVVVDDGQTDGEWIRLRSDSFVIGRTEGDLRIGCDSLISGRHAELSRQRVAGVWRWVITDLDSTNGTFVRVGTSRLKHGQEFLIGQSHYRFEVPSIPDDPTPSGSTRKLHAGTAPAPGPVLVRLRDGGEIERHPLLFGEVSLGRDPARCAIVVGDDPSVSPVHARLTIDDRGRWHIENCKSANGLWLRIRRLPLDQTCQFQLGEQRFILKMM